MCSKWKTQGKAFQKEIVTSNGDSCSPYFIFLLKGTVCIWVFVPLNIRGHFHTWYKILTTVYVVHPKLDLVNVVVRPLLFTKFKIESIH